MNDVEKENSHSWGYYDTDFSGADIAQFNFVNRTGVINFSRRNNAD